MSFIASSRDGLRNVLRHAPRHSLSIRNASSSASSSSAIAPLSSPPQVTLAGMKPRHIYRRILRHAHSIAKRWKDPFIFWTVKHLAMRNLGYKRGFEGNVMLPWIEPESWQTPPPKERPKYVIQITSQTDTERTFIAYKRLQRLCRQVANADRGTKPEMWKLLKQTYALAGPNMYMAKKKLFATHLFSDRKPETHGQHFPSFPPSPLLLALLQSPSACSSPIVKHDETWTRLIIQYANATNRQLRESGIKALKKMPFDRAVKSRLDKMTPPMPFEVVRDLESRMDLTTKQYIQMRIAQGTQSLHPQDDVIEQGEFEDEPEPKDQPKINPQDEVLPDPTRKGPLHPSSPDFLRSQRRLYGFLLNDLSALITVDQLKRAWDRTITTPNVAARESMQYKTLPPLHDTSSPDYWLTKPHLQFKLQNLWCSKLRLAPQGTHDVYMRTNDKLRAAHEVLPLELPSKEDQMHYKTLPNGWQPQDVARDIIWIYKSPMAITFAGLPSVLKNNVMWGSEAFVSPQEAEMARESKLVPGSPTAIKKKQQEGKDKGDEKHAKPQENEENQQDINGVQGETAQADQDASHL